MTTINLEQIKYSWKNTWANNTAYVVRDTIYGSPHSYVCITAHTSHASDASLVTSDSAYWSILTGGDEGATFGGDLTGTASNAQIAAGAVGATEIATDAVTANEIVAGAVGTTEIATNAVTVNELATTLDLSSKTITFSEATVTDHVQAVDINAMEDELAVIAFNIAGAGAFTKYHLVDQNVDIFVDGSGIDDTASTNEVFTESGINNSTKLMLHMDGFDDGVTFADSSSSKHVFTRKLSGSAGGDTKTKQAEKKFGNASCRFNENGMQDYIHAPISTDFLFDASEDFTIEAWVKFVVTGNYQGIISCKSAGSGSAYHGWSMRTDAGGLLSFNYWLGGSNQWAVNSTTSVTDGSWHHCAVVRNSNTIRVFVDGVQEATHTFADEIQGSQGASAGLILGTDYVDNIGSGSINAYVDEVRLIKGIAKYTGTFTPQTAAYRSSGYYSGLTNDMTLISEASTANAVPIKGDIMLTYTNNTGTATINTDIKAYISRDDGTTWTLATLESIITTGGNILISAHDVDISSQPSGTAMRYKIETLSQGGTIDVRIQAVSLGWSQ